MGRKDAERTFTLEEFETKMEGVVSNDINIKHIDESPMAYKDISTVIDEVIEKRFLYEITMGFAYNFTEEVGIIETLNYTPTYNPPT